MHTRYTGLCPADDAVSERACSGIRRNASEIIRDEAGTLSGAVVRWILATLIFAAAFFLLWHFVVEPRFDTWMRDAYTEPQIFNLEDADIPVH